MNKDKLGPHKEELEIRLFLISGGSGIVSCLNDKCILWPRSLRHRRVYLGKVDHLQALLLFHANEQSRNMCISECPELLQ